MLEKGVVFNSSGMGWRGDKAAWTHVLALLRMEPVHGSKHADLRFWDFCGCCCCGDSDCSGLTDCCSKLVLVNGGGGTNNASVQGSGLCGDEAQHVLATKSRFRWSNND